MWRNGASSARPAKASASAAWRHRQPIGISAIKPRKRRNGQYQAREVFHRSEEKNQRHRNYIIPKKVINLLTRESGPSASSSCHPYTRKSAPRRNIYILMFPTSRKRHTASGENILKIRSERKRNQKYLSEERSNRISATWPHHLAAWREEEIRKIDGGKA